MSGRAIHRHGTRRFERGRARAFAVAGALAATCLLVVLAAEPAFAAPGPVTVYVAGARTGETPSRAAVQARLGEQVDLYAVVRVGSGRRATWYTDAPGLRERRRVPAKRIRPFAELGATSVRWALVEPHQQHVETPAPNAPNPAYSNSVLFGPQHGRWLGYDTLEYVETPLDGATRPTLTVRMATPTDRRLWRNGGLGTMRYTVSVTLRDPRWTNAPGETTAVDGAHRAPGALASERGGIREEVFRVSFRRGDDLVGWLTTYFNVPNVFGSAGHGDRHQTDRYQGADCADLIVGAARRAGARIAYSSAAGLTRYARPVTEPLVVDETGVYEWDGAQAGARVSLAWPAEVGPGDIVLIDYVGFTATGRSWDHVGVLTADGGVAGRFDPADSLVHVGYLAGPKEEPLHRQGPAVIQVLRWKPRHQRAFDRQRRRLGRAASDQAAGPR